MVVWVSNSMMIFPVSDYSINGPHPWPTWILFDVPFQIILILIHVYNVYGDDDDRLNNHPLAFPT